MINIGDKVFTVRNSTQKSVYSFGTGTYNGKDINPTTRKMDDKTTLDNGDVVYGTDCFITPVANTEKEVGGRILSIVDIDNFENLR